MQVSTAHQAVSFVLVHAQAGANLNLGTSADPAAASSPIAAALFAISAHLQAAQGPIQSPSHPSWMAG